MQVLMNHKLAVCQNQFSFFEHLDYYMKNFGSRSIRLNFQNHLNVPHLLSFVQTHDAVEKHVR